MSSKIQLRRDSAANWTATNPVLAQGEPGLETDTKKVKYGDGSTAWNLLDYASGGSGGDFSTGFEDGINENTYHFATVTGKKEFTFYTEGYKLIRITLTAPMIANLVADSDLTFTATDTPQMTDLWFNVDRWGNSVYVYLASEYDVNTLSSMYNSMTSPSAGTFKINVGTTSMSVGDIIVIKYWSEGTMYNSSRYDNYGWYIPDVSESAASNTVTLSNDEYYDWLGSSTNAGDAFYDLVNPDLLSKHSITFWQDDKGDVRNVTAVEDNGDGTFTITFDGTAVQSKTTETVSFTYLAPDNRENDLTLSLPMSAYPTFNKEAGDINNSTTNKYTGGQNRSGYLTINGGSPINFFWYQGSVNETTWGLYMDSTPVTYTAGDTIAVTFYRAATNIEVNIYRPQNTNWNNGYKWFDWKDDIETEYSPGEGNGVQAGQAQILMVQYREAIGSWDENKSSMAVQFGWTNNGGEQTDPYDPYNQSWISNGYYQDNSEPLHDFDEEGIIFYNSSTYNDFSKTYKVRIIYKFNLIIGDDIYTWFDC